MFSEVHAKLDAKMKKVLECTNPPSPSRVKKILESSQDNELTYQEIAKLLEIGNDTSCTEQFLIMKRFLYENFRGTNNQLRYIAPIYLSSHCIDKCGYCQFAVNRKDTQRTRLTLAEFEKEIIEGILPDGIKVIELTLATDPYFSPEILEGYISLTNSLLRCRKGSGILLCSDHLTEETYKELKFHGLWGVVQWDETLDRVAYYNWHRGSPRKSRMDERMDNHDRALAAGLEIATGCLFGLADYRYDVLMQIGKTRYLEDQYGRKPFLFGTPRIKSIGGKNIPRQFHISDFQYETALMVYKIAEPFVSRWLQTRETLQLNLRNIVDGDIYTYKCGEVKPGGYILNSKTIDAKKGGQFSVHEQEKSFFESELKKIRFNLNYAWVN